ncbi:hypothetical protein [Kitasatospora sp. CB01950]|uniref:hypothetical protein n=1 Tax=Kitasatospora sp. CB01950 TaxID=1703930 RepID=UPI001300EA92|nr:hypothetical protein [Kitasatospora sp. CB01950]
MEAPTLQASPAGTLVLDEAFDLVVGELEQLAPEHAPSATTCGLHLYCVLQ